MVRAIKCKNLILIAVIIISYKMIASAISTVKRNEAKENCFIATDKASSFCCMIIVPSVEYRGAVDSIE